MTTPEYRPFNNPREVGWLMADLFDLYSSYEPDSFPFEWLQKTIDLEVRCKDATEEKIDFPTPPALLKAIHACQKIMSPETTRELPSDFGFTGFMETAVDEIRAKVQITEPEE
jgi:hypothetical protein